MGERHPQAVHGGSVGVIEALRHEKLDEVAPTRIREWLRSFGVLVLRGFEADSGAARALTECLGRIVKTVEVTGTQYVGYHAELAYTPFPPDLLCFHCSSPWEGIGGETTFCDGIRILKEFSPGLTHFLETHRLSLQSSWSSRFLRGRFELESNDDLRERLSGICGLTWTEHPDDEWRLSFFNSAIGVTQFQGARAFVNSLVIALHDDRPRPERAYSLTLEDGSAFPAVALTEILEITRAFTYYLRWSAGDYVVVDNSRMLHGRSPCVAAGSAVRRLVNMHTVLREPREMPT